MKRWTWQRSVLGVLVVSAGLGVGWVWSNTEDESMESRFRTADIDEGAITQVVMANGSLQPVTTVIVGAAVSGTVIERLVDFNDPVRKGQVLLRLDPANFEARVRQASAQWASAEAKFAYASGNFERNEVLLARGFISAPQRDQSRREMESARADLNLAGAQLDTAKNDLNNSVIRAPVDGVVIKRSVDVGQTVVASFQTPELFLIAKDLRQMVIQVNVSEADVGQIREDQSVRFVVDAFPAREFEGRVQQFRLNATNTQGVVTYTVIVNVANADGLLKPGMTAQTRIVVATKPNVLRLPTAALRFRPDEDELKSKTLAKPARNPTGATTRTNDDGVLSNLRDGARVFHVYTVGEDQTPLLHEVTVGISNTRFTELVSGKLKRGDAVITRRAHLDKKDSL